ncbi:hypothetical protein DL765_010688 [Monosporascus sp. GIB2]|nr:hypothetical protein DL765_010688 [Monosporascus sp. GIB2]
MPATAVAVTIAENKDEDNKERLLEPPALAVRKRKARTPPPLTQPPSATRLEEKLDDLGTLLRAQPGERQPQAPEQQQAPQASPRRALEGSADTMLSTLARDPDVVVDTATSVVHLLRPASPHIPLSPVLDDVSVHGVPDRLGEEQLGLFRRVFVPMFPFIHIPTTLSAAELRLQKPCVWLAIMSLTTKSSTFNPTAREAVFADYGGAPNAPGRVPSFIFTSSWEEKAEKRHRQS